MYFTPGPEEVVFPIFWEYAVKRGFGYVVVKGKRFLVKGAELLTGDKLKLACEELGGLSRKFGRSCDGVAPDFAKSTGRLGGALWGKSRISTLQRFLEKRGVTVLTNQEELLAKLARQAGLEGADAAFVVGKDGKLWFLLAENPTRREVLHELSHFLHRQRIGADAYGALTKAEKEVWVARFLRESNNWKKFAPEEQWRELQSILDLVDGGQ